ncbi:uncharacterized protein LOC104907193 isoform X2 [Beta vulgaris subsp. vulgaris]|uniref:uncharacterized protein LOC104907193 isoform X2 n=1 Tax=Beta vulgaris subsp. vulgaris TaxID=3555 RepID=UPI0025485CB1|nr:uncharacterized protein LOC104907193 isoform X2 [Beta vulgaris subsp. vulgaris]
MASATLNGVSMNGFASSLVCYLPNFHAFPRISTFSSSCFYSSSSGPGMYKVHHLLRASSEELSSELVEDSKFVPLEAEDPSYGPPAILLLGFQVEEADKIQQLLKDLDGEFLQIAKSVPRICFLSGLSGEEMMMFIDSFEETGLEPAVFAAHVPNSSDKSLLELTEEIMGDHEMLSAKQSDPK